MNFDKLPLAEPPEPIEEETTNVGDVVFKIKDLEKMAESIPTVEAPTERFQEWVSEDHRYWVDRNGESFGPSQILSDPHAAESHLEWADHLTSIKRGDFSKPIWALADTGQVIDGMHRLTNAFLNGRVTVPVKFFDREAILKLKRES